MKIFKLKVSDTKIYPIDKETFINVTQRRNPWFENNTVNEEKRFFGVCPACENTIEIVGFKERDKVKPYGRHYLHHPIPNLGFLDRRAYEVCPYRREKRRRTVSREERNTESARMPNKILHLLLSQFDRVIYLLDKTLPLKVSKVYARQILKDFKGTDGWRYTGATQQNIPWIFAYFSDARLFWGLEINSQKLQEALKKRYPSAYFEKGYLKSKEYIKPTFCFVHHKRELIKDELMESMTFSVSDENIKIFYQQEIKFELMYFANLCQYKDQSKRDLSLVHLAEEFFPEYDENNALELL